MRNYVIYILMAALWNRAGNYIFVLWFVISYFLSFYRATAMLAWSWES